MNLRAVLRVLGAIVLAIGAAMLPSAIFAFLDRTGDLHPLLFSAATALLVGGVLVAATRRPEKKVDFGARDGFAIVTFGWIAAGLAGALPYLLSGACPNPVDALFESLSGFTTTGATIFTDIESLPRGILFWRSTTHWLGGMGIVVLSVAVLPMLGVGGMQLFRAEAPGPTTERLAPRIQSTAKLLWGVYVGISTILAVLLMAGGMSVFESLCHTFGTVSTGGFSTRNASVGGFDSAYIDTVITVFMFICGANFALHYGLIRRHLSQYTGNEEFRVYGVVTLIAIAMVWGHLTVKMDMAPLEALRYAGFQAVAIITTTGFGTADFLLWGFGIQLLLLALMFFGGCAGSTAGSMKFMRVILLTKHGVREMKRLLHRQGVFNIKLSGRRVQDEVMLNVLGFFLLYVTVFLGGALLLAALGVDVLTAVGASAASIGNIGPGLGEVGPAGNYAGLPSLAKIILSLEMVMGRLELFTVLVVLSPMFWRRT